MFSRDLEVIVPATALLGAVSPFSLWLLGKASSEVAVRYYYYFKFYYYYWLYCSACRVFFSNQGLNQALGNESTQS